MNRRDFLVLWLQALLLSLFPWLRTGRGIVLAEQAAEASVDRVFGPGLWRVSVILKGFEIGPEQESFFKKLQEERYLFQLPPIDLIDESAHRPR